MAEQFTTTGSWENDEKVLTSNGVTQEEILEEKGRRTEYLLEQGVQEKDIAEYFGSKETDISYVKQSFSENIKNNIDKITSPVEKIFSGFGSGFGSTGVGLTYKSVNGDALVTEQTINPEYADTYYKVGQGLGSIVSDIPVMTVGATVGAIAVGATAMGVGTALAGPAGTLGGGVMGIASGGFIGANALPAVWRSALIDTYKNGEFKSFGDFWNRASTVAMQGMKEATISAIGFKTGQVVSKAAPLLAGSPQVTSKALQYASNTSQVSAEVATMTTLGKYIEGETPTWEDFATNLFTIGAVHGITGSVGLGMSKISKDKMADVYVKTGIKPDEVAQLAEENPQLKYEILNNSESIPKDLERFIVKEEIDAVEVLKSNALKAKEVTKVAEEVVANDAEIPAHQETKNKIIENTVLKEDLAEIDSPYKSTWSVYQNANEAIRTAIKGLDKAEKFDENNAYALANLFDNGVGVANSFWKKGVKQVGDSEKRVTKGYEEIINPFVKSKELSDFDAYRKARRYLEYERKGLKQPYSLDDLKKIVSDGDAKYLDANKDIQNWKNENLKWGVGEVFSKETYDIVTSNNLDHVNLKSVLTEEGNIVGGSGLTVKKKAVGQKTANITESSFLSDFDSAQAIHKQRDLNIIRRTFGEKLLENKLAEEVVTTAPKLTKDEIKYFEEIAGRELSKDELSAMYTLRTSKDLKKTEIEYNTVEKTKNENGEVVDVFKKKRVDLKDEYLAEVVNKMGTVEELNVLLRFAKSFSDIKRAGITELNPSWGVGNLTADTWGTMLKLFDRKDPTRPFRHLAQMMNVVPDILGRSPDYWKFVESKANSGNLINSQEWITKSLKREVALKNDTIVDNVYNLGSDARKVFAATWDLWDMPNRMARWKSGIESGESNTEAAFAAAEISVNFRTKGSSDLNNKISLLNAYRAAGFNALRNTFNTFNDRKGDLAIAGAAFVTAPYIMSWFNMKDDERWQKMEPWVKQKYLIFMTDNWQAASPEDMPLVEAYQESGSNLLRQEGGVYYLNKGNVHKLKMPEVYGTIFGYIPITMLDYAYRKDPVSTAEAVQKMLGSVAVNVTGFPTDFGMPVLEAAMNKDIFRDAPLVSGLAEDALPEEKYTNYTSETAKEISKIFSQLGPDGRQFQFSEEDKKHLSYIERKALPYMEEAVGLPLKEVGKLKVFGGQELMAPIVIDNFVKKWTGIIGKTALEISDKALEVAGVTKDKVKPPSQWADVPVIGALFVRDFASNTVYISEFEKIVRNEYTPYKNSLSIEQRKLDNGDVRFNEKKYDTLTNYLDQRAELKDYIDTIKEMQQLIVETDANPDYSPQEKKQLIQSYYYYMNEAAKNGILINRQINQDVEQLKEMGIEQ